MHVAGRCTTVENKAAGVCNGGLSDGPDKTLNTIMVAGTVIVAIACVREEQRFTGIAFGRSDGQTFTGTDFPTGGRVIARTAIASTSIRHLGGIDQIRKSHKKAP